MKLFPTLCMAMLFSLPALSETFTPKHVPNPWNDDYSAISGMENWKSWGTYNVHDPSCRKIGDYYYMYSTDAIFREDHKAAEAHGVPLGFIQMRRSRDLVNWEFIGWVFPEIPADAVSWVKEKSGGHGATNVWAPYIVDCGDGNFVSIIACRHLVGIRHI